MGRRGAAAVGNGDKRMGVDGVGGRVMVGSGKGSGYSS